MRNRHLTIAFTRAYNTSKKVEKVEKIEKIKKAMRLKRLKKINIRLKNEVKKRTTKDEKG